MRRTSCGASALTVPQAWSSPLTQPSSRARGIGARISWPRRPTATSSSWTRPFGPNRSSATATGSEHRAGQSRSQMTLPTDSSMPTALISPSSATPPQSRRQTQRSTTFSQENTSGNLSGYEARCEMSSATKSTTYISISSSRRMGGRLGLQSMKTRNTGTSSPTSLVQKSAPSDATRRFSADLGG